MARFSLRAILRDLDHGLTPWAVHHYAHLLFRVLSPLGLAARHLRCEFLRHTMHSENLPEFSLSLLERLCRRGALWTFLLALYIHKTLRATVPRRSQAHST